jgi:hypothetical protein
MEVKVHLASACADSAVIRPFTAAAVQVQLAPGKQLLQHDRNAALRDCKRTSTWLCSFGYVDITVILAIFVLQCR